MIDEQHEFVCTDCGTTVQADAKVCPKCGASFEDPIPEANPPELLSPEWAKDIETKLAKLEAQFPKSDIVSHSFWKRAWTVYGYSLAAGMVVVLALFFLALLFKACTG